jgi:protein-S-isoprenylcysteine O-methyltransferase Ste14
MNTELIFQILSFLVFVSAISISVYYRRKADMATGAQLRTKEGSKLLVVLRLLALIALAPLLIYFVNPAWVLWARFPLPEWVRWVAALVGVAVVPMVYWVLSSIGNNISPVQATRQNHKLVMHGPYKYIRHPLYTVGSLLVLALIFMTGLWWIAAVGALPLILILLRTPVEEARLIETFGDEYRDYMKRTGRFLPKIGN